ncbi:MAG: hypothetical protein ACOCZU_06190 [Planctomycetota bacterium]
MSPMGESLKRQFGQAFDVLEAAVRLLDDSQWRQGGSPYDGPARGTLHALQAAEYYTHGRSEVFRWQGKGVWEMDSHELPDQQEMLDYLAAVRSINDEWIASLDRGPLAVGGEQAGQALDRAVYAVRHLQHHTGEVCAWMKQFGHPQETWV